MRPFNKHFSYSNYRQETPSIKGFLLIRSFSVISKNFFVLIPCTRRYNTFQREGSNFEEMLKFMYWRALSKNLMQSYLKNKQNIFHNECAFKKRLSVIQIINFLYCHFSRKQVRSYKRKRKKTKQFHKKCAYLPKF